MKEFTLFFFPYAGGSAKVYKSWEKSMPSEIEMVYIDPPGRGRRIGEKPCQSIEQMLEDVFDQIKDRLEDGKYAFFGHSMGGIIAHEMVYKIREAGLPEPEYLFLSGRGAPHVEGEDDDDDMHLLPDDQFIERLNDYGGTPKQVLENKELMDLFLPILRSDFKVCNEYEYSTGEEPFDFGITIFTGLEEELSDAKIEGWQKYTKHKLRSNRFPGGHFFLHEEKNKHHILRIISRTIFDIIEESPEVQVG